MKKLINFFVQCSCGEDVKMEEIDQVRICSCGKEVRIAESVKTYLRKEYSQPIEAEAIA
jgi:hypothetical protein